MGYRYGRPQRSSRRMYSDLIGNPPVASGYTTPNLQGDGVGVSTEIARSKIEEKLAYWKATVILFDCSHSSLPSMRTTTLI